jgi:hypothetical protein
VVEEVDADDFTGLLDAAGDVGVGLGRFAASLGVIVSQDDPGGAALIQGERNSVWSAECGMRT